MFFRTIPDFRIQNIFICQCIDLPHEVRDSMVGGKMGSEYSQSTNIH